MLVELILHYQWLKNTQRKQELIRQHADRVWNALEALSRDGGYKEFSHLLVWNEMACKSGCLERSDFARWESRMDETLEMKKEYIDECAILSRLDFVDLCKEIIRDDPQFWLTKGSSMR